MSLIRSPHYIRVGIWSLDPMRAYYTGKLQTLINLLTVTIGQCAHEIWTLIGPLIITTDPIEDPDLGIWMHLCS